MRQLQIGHRICLLMKNDEPSANCQTTIEIIPIIWHKEAFLISLQIMKCGFLFFFFFFFEKDGRIIKYKQSSGTDTIDRLRKDRWSLIYLENAIYATHERKYWHTCRKEVTAKNHKCAALEWSVITEDRRGRNGEYGLNLFNIWSKHE